MELNENEFNFPTGNTQFFNNLQHFHFQQQVDHFSMSSYIPSPEAQARQSFTPSAELCQKVVDKSGGRKRKRGSKGAMEGLSPSDVIHVRAKRGQATDSHSLAERVRRKKINEKLKSLHDIVPGCHQTMGMAVMLDVVIKYIQSLQNQIEFLSMKLLAASLFHDLNSSDMDAVEITRAPQQMGDVQEMERFATEGYGGGAPYLNSTLFPQESLQNQ